MCYYKMQGYYVGGIISIEGLRAGGWKRGGVGAHRPDSTKIKGGR